jgi:hypothetical protein
MERLNTNLLAAENNAVMFMRNVMDPAFPISVCVTKEERVKITCIPLVVDDVRLPSAVI